MGRSVGHKLSAQSVFRFMSFDQFFYDRRRKANETLVFRDKKPIVVESRKFYFEVEECSYLSVSLNSEHSIKHVEIFMDLLDFLSS